MEKNTSRVAKIWVPPPSTFSLISEDRSKIEPLNDLSFLSVAFKPRRRDPFFLSTEGVHAGAITQWSTDAPFGFVSSPKVALNKVTIRFVSSGTIVRRNSYSDYVGSPGKAMFVAFEEMITEEASAGFVAFAGTIDKSALLACHMALEDDDVSFPQFESVVDVSSAQMRAFRHNFHLIYERLRTGLDPNDLNFPLLQEIIIYQFLTAWPRLSEFGGNGVILRPSWQVRRAMEYVDANLQSKITLREIASVAQCSVRSLQASFKKELGKTPVGWIIERRLAGVRSELKNSLDPNLSIAEVAKRWGFAHFSDFSRRYKDRYGETPLKSRQMRG